MKIYAMPAAGRIEAVLFDMDSTLYTHDEYAAFQIESPIRRFAEIRRVPFETARSEIEAYRAEWARSHGGAALSLGNALEYFGISLTEIVKWREELYDPADFLGKDERLRGVLEELKKSCALAVVTNNPVLAARKTLAALGVAHCFSVIVGLDTCMVSKPHEAPFLKAASACGATPHTCLAVGDRYDIDIAVPLKLGMGGIVVDGVEDVYRLLATRL
ncbi:MAG: HAD family hydrolase [Spirochaetaceae bacterium]|jgi:phosphoglycolate phosphatase/putative hydrolase of the HAD superfamily|nr:HAD family hydrolase [Spirochaetaceae bacterium]